MTVESSAQLRHTKWRLEKRTIGKPVIYIFLAALNLVYIFVKAHTPIAVYPGAPHDDTLFMLLGNYLAQGEWLGPYNQFTLLKGPGYPAFLAVSHLLGISVSVATALLHCIATTFFVVICHRFIKSYLLTALLFILLLWHPISLSVYVLRVFRDSLYFSQVLLFLAAALATLFYAAGRTQVLAYAALAGITLGWLSLTREEGIWLVPALAVMLTAAALRAFDQRRVRQFVETLAVIVLVFGGTHIAYRATNWWVYGSFVGVDFKEANYQRALGAIHGVRSGEVKPFISITKAARERVYAVSPSFATLKDYFEGGAGAGWAVHSCVVIKAACNTSDIGPGHFVFALRDAAASQGYYASPAKASIFFGHVADEILAACAHDTLECVSPLINEIPPVSLAEFKQRLPANLTVAARAFMPISFPTQINGSGGDEDALALRLRFLNYPLHERISGAASLASYQIGGWYYKSRREWFTASMRDPGGVLAELGITRNGSPDIQAMSKDPEASNQRFFMHTRCSEECVLVIEAEGTKVEKKLSELRLGPQAFPVGSGYMGIDHIASQNDPIYERYPADTFARRIREFDLRYYQYAFLPVLGLGLIAFLLASLRYWRQATFNICFILALTSWVLALTRVFLLAILDTMFDTAAMVNPFYGAPTYYHLVCGAVFSIAAWFQLYRQRSLQPPYEMAAFGPRRDIEI
jgi:hypothetical protein